MFIGHYGIAYAAKAKYKKIPLWILFLAVQILDILSAVFIIFGIEQLAQGSNSNPYLNNAFTLPYSHSLIGALLISILVFIACNLFQKKNWAWILFLLVLSHWVIDVIFHTRDLPLWGNYKIGLGLWDFALLSFAIEIIILLLGWILYDKYKYHKSLASIFLVLFMIIWFTGMLFLPEPVLVRENPLVKTLVFLIFNLLTVWGAFCLDKK